MSKLNSNTLASEPFTYEETVEYTSNCEFLLKIYHTYPPLSAIYSLTTSDADVSENTPLFKNGSINNLCWIDISQSVDWEYPSLFPHFLMLTSNSYKQIFGKFKNPLWKVDGNEGCVFHFQVKERNSSIYTRISLWSNLILGNMPMHFFYRLRSFLYSTNWGSTGVQGCVRTGFIVS